MTIRERRCPQSGIHEPHHWTRKGDPVLYCPGEPHDHERFCCMEHHHHRSPHVGCILR